MGKLIQYDAKHREIPDPTPMEMPVGYEQPESLESMIRRMISNNEYLNHFKGAESEEEADDFDVSDDELPASPYEFQDMREEFLAEVKQTPTPTAKNKKEEGVTAPANHKKEEVVEGEPVSTGP